MVTGQDGCHGLHALYHVVLVVFEIEKEHVVTQHQLSTDEIVVALTQKQNYVSLLHVQVSISINVKYFCNLDQEGICYVKDAKRKHFSDNF